MIKNRIAVPRRPVELGPSGTVQISVGIPSTAMSEIIISEGRFHFACGRGPQ